MLHAKTRIARWIVWPALALGLLSCGSGVSLPSELLGKWGDTCCGGCARSFTFSSSSFVFAESCPYTGSDGYNSDIAEIYTAESMFRTPDDMYFAWHVVGTTLYLNKTNPGSSKPDWSGQWWTSPGYTLTKQ
jgi:hypothetical protein